MSWITKISHFDRFFQCIKSLLIKKMLNKILLHQTHIIKFRIYWNVNRNAFQYSPFSNSILQKSNQPNVKKNRQIQYHPAHMGNCGYRSDSTIDRKHFTGVDRTNNLRTSHANSSSHFNTGWQDNTWSNIFEINNH